MKSYAICAILGRHKGIEKAMRRRCKLVVRQIAVGPMLNFSYLIGDEATKEAIVIDPSWEPDRLYEIAVAEGLNIRYIVNSHCHEDHVNGNSRMKELTNACIAMHESESQYLRHFYPPAAELILKGNDSLKIGKTSLSVIHSPGHSPGSICILADNKLFTGDTLFVGSCGRTDLPGGDEVVFRETMQMIKGMDDKIDVYPGHNYGKTLTSTIGREKISNQCLNLL